MVLLKNFLKAAIIGLFVFFILTVLLTVVVRYTAFSIKCCYYPMVAILAITTLAVSYLLGISIGEKGVAIGLISSILMEVLIIAITESVFVEAFECTKKTILLSVPVFTGILGGVMGVNSNK